MIGAASCQASYDPPSFTLRLLHKDVSLGVQLAREVNVPMRITNLVLEELTEALNRGWGGRDSKAVMAMQVERAGLPPIKVPQAQIKAVMEKD